MLSGNKDIKSIRELSIIIRISQSIISTLDYQKVLQIISDGMSELLEIDSAAIYLLSDDQELILGATTPPLDPNMPDEFRKAKLIDHLHIQRAVSSREPIVVLDTKSEQFSQGEKIILEARQLRSLIYLPFVHRDSVLGVLILGTLNKPRPYTEHEINLGRTVANQLSIAIQNARFHSDLENYNNNLEKIVAERTCELEAANEELKAINDELLEKNKIVLKQKEEIERSLASLKALQVKLIQSEKMASLGVLTAGVAHEINNPLNFIMGAYEGFDDFFTNTAPEHKIRVSVLLNGLKEGVDRASAIVQGLNQFSRDSKNYDESCDVQSILDNCLVMLNNQYKEKINIRKSYTADEIAVRGNAGKLHQAFTNILTNAIQSIDEKGTISIITQSEQNSLFVYIRDTGCGIPAENMQKIMDPFFTTKDPSMGTGLGLSITYNIIQEHRGQIEFESEVNKGTTVKIILPSYSHNS